MALDDPTAAEFRERWRALFGSEPPARAPDLVAQAVAWREQVLAHGDVPAHVLRDLRAVASENAVPCSGKAPVTSVATTAVPVSTALPPDVPISSPRNTAPARNRHRSAAPRSRMRVDPLSPASSQLVPGTRLVKAHGGRTHVVEVTSDGMLYEGQLFASLSAVAKHITGTHWNGLLFFGLRRRKTYPKAAADA